MPTSNSKSKSCGMAPHSLPRMGLVLGLFQLTACMVGPKYHQPEASKEELPSHYKEATNGNSGAGWTVANPHDQMLRGEWWKVFKDPELNELEAQLNINNQNIRQYFENFMTARALVGEAISQLYPTITANGSYTRSRSPGGGGSSVNLTRSSSGTSTSTSTGASTTGTTSSASAGSTSSRTSANSSRTSGGGGGGGGTISTNFLTTLNLTWEPDLWGKVRNAIRSAQYSAQLSAADLENERLTEQASLAMYYFQLRGQDALQKLYNETVEADKKALDYNKAQYETGITDKISVVEAENTLQNAQATATNIGVARAQYEHAIAMLIGKVASNFSIPVRPFISEPPSIPIGLPSQLLERRPDIAAAERNMASANAQIGIAYAAYFPTVTLAGDFGFDSSRISNLFSASNRVWSYGPSVSETVFDAGLRAATVRQYVATYNANLATYRQAVLVAFQQVEDYLAQVRILSRQLIIQRQAEDTAKEYLKLEMGRFQTGIDPYVNVVTAQTTLLTDQQAVISVQVQEMTAAIQLIEALGGGWDHSQLPTPEAVSKTPSKEEQKIQN